MAPACRRKPTFMRVGGASRISHQATVWRLHWIAALELSSALRGLRRSSIGRLFPSRTTKDLETGRDPQPLATSYVLHSASGGRST